MLEPKMKLEIVVRSEIALAQIHARRMASRSALFSIALVFLMLGLGMMTLALYSAIEPVIGAPLAAFSVSMIDALFGGIFIFAARHSGPPGNEEKLAREIRDMAYSELGKDYAAFRGEVKQFTSDIDRIRAGLTSFSSGAVGTLSPVISLLLNIVNRNR